MKNAWMVRSGRGGSIVESCLQHGVVAIGWTGMLDISRFNNKAEIAKAVADFYPHKKPGAQQAIVGVLSRFLFDIQIGDTVITYSPEHRFYHVGTVTGKPQYRPEILTDFPQQRPVQWHPSPVSRDSLSVRTRNSLGSTLTIFKLNSDVATELQHPSPSPSTAQAEHHLSDDESEIDATIRRSNLEEESREWIKDLLRDLADDDMEELLASVLRAMGYKARVSPKGPDRGVDITASPDGLGLENPRIKAEVKHRPNSAMGAPEIRNFSATLRNQERGIYLSTGGFTKEARYEAERSVNHLSLLTLDDLYDLVTDHYERLDSNGRALINLTRIWIPA